jgi:hypothetical protein
MDAKTLEALKASIEKWKRNAVAETPDDYKIGGNDCPLCEMFQSKSQGFEGSCQGCPVFSRTGRRFCSGTPYADTVRAHDGMLAGDPDTIARARAAALVEVAFLESLLPEGERP